MKSMHIPILYGSQTGNSELAAQNLASSLPSTLNSPSSSVQITSEALELDDFLEHRKGAWTPLIIIICSSYGVGQAPMGAWKFREMCDLILAENDKYASHFQGVQYALLGLGDSKYTTFFLNPTALDSAMAKAGAVRVGSLGKADASGEGDQLQQTVIEQWCESIVDDLKRVVDQLGKMDDVQWEGKEEEMAKAKENTGELCRLIYDDWDEKKQGGDGSADEKSALGGTLQQFLIFLLGILLAYFVFPMFKSE